MLKKSEFLKNRKIQILLCVELLLFLLGVAGLFGRTGVVVGREHTAMLQEEGVELPAGAYTLRIYYATEIQGMQVGDFGVEVENAMFKSILSNGIPLYAGLTQRECDFYLRDSVEKLTAVVNVDSGVTVEALEIEATTKGSRIFLFWVLLGSLLVDTVLMLSMYHRKYPLSREKQLAIFGVPALALIASIPCLVDYNIIGADLMYHVLRIEALADSIRNGELPVRISSYWLCGHGYAGSLFYCDTFLALPAFLRIIGFSPESACRLFMTGINLATAVIAYVSFSRAFQNRSIGIFGCVLYTLAPYRVYNMYNRAAVGEVTAMIFLPLLVWGFYKIYTENVEDRKYRWNWVIPTIGFSGIIQSHTLSCEMAGFFVILLCLVLWKKTFRRRTFMVLLSTVLMTVVINAWYLVPFLDLMTADKYYFSNNANVLIQSRGIYSAQIFYTLQAGGSSSRFVENGMVDTEPIGLGAALLLCIGLWLFMRYRYRRTASPQAKKEMRAADVVLGMLVLALFMSTCCFPWDFLSSCNRILATLVGSIQFPTRITAMVSILGTFVACVMGVWVLRENAGFLSGRMLLALVAAVAILFGNYQLNDILLTRNEFVRLYSAQNMGTTGVLGAEYLPLGVEIGHMSYHAPVSSPEISLETYQKEGLSVSAYVTAEREGYVEFPMLCYKGYHARVTETGSVLPVEKGDNGDVRVRLPGNFSGEIEVWYGGMWYWRVAEAVSVLAGVGAFVYERLWRRRRA